MKRIAVITDMHCGHRAGLTPPEYQYQENDSDKELAKFGEIQRHIWNYYTKTIDSLQPIDILFELGDSIEGKGERSGGTELFTSDRIKQVEIAKKCINYTQAKTKIKVFGTPYHVGVSEDFESLVAEGVGASISSHEWVDVNGVVFDLKHFVSSSSIPHGRHTAIARSKLWNTIWSERKGQPKSNVLLRGHTHYFDYNGNASDLNIICPALQGWGSKFGSRICEGIVDIGLIHFDVEDKNNWSWKYHLLESELLTVEPLKL